MAIQMSDFLRLRGQRGCNCRDQPFPAICFLSETLPAGRREFIEFCATIVVRRAPFGLKQSLAHQAEKSWIERSLLDQQRLAGNLADAEKNPVPMEGPERNGL